MSLKDILIKNTLWILSADIVDKVLSYFLIVALARTLGDVGLGEYSFVFAFAGLTFLLADFGVGYYLLRESARSTRRMQTIFSNAFSIKILLIFLAFAATALFMLVISKPSHVMMSIIVLSTILALQYIGNLFEAIFQARNKMHLGSIARVLERVVAFAIGLYVLLRFKSLLMFFTILLIAYLFRFFYEIYYGRRFVRIRLSFDKEVVKEIFKAGVPLWLTGVFAFIYFRIDIVMLSLMINDQVVGWYSAAYKLIDALNFIPYLVFTATFPSMSLLFEKNKKLMGVLLNRVLRYMIYLAIPMVIGTVLLADRILQFIYGELFSNSVIALQILIFAEAMVFITFLLGTSLNAMNKEKYLTYTVASLSLFNIALNFLLIPKYSYAGAAFATVTTELLNLIILTLLIRKFLTKVRYELAKPMIAAMIMGAAVYALRFLPIWWLIPIGMAIYFMALLLLGLKQEDKDLLDQLIRKAASHIG